MKGDIEMWRESIRGYHHLSLPDRRYQISLHDSPAGRYRVFVLHLAGARPFDSLDEQLCSSLEGARAWGEEYARRLYPQMGKEART